MRYRDSEPGNRTLLFVMMLAVIALAVAAAIVIPQLSSDHVKEVEIHEQQKLIFWGGDEAEVGE